MFDIALGGGGYSVIQVSVHFTKDQVNEILSLFQRPWVWWPRQRSQTTTKPMYITLPIDKDSREFLDSEIRDRVEKRRRLNEPEKELADKKGNQHLIDLIWESVEAQIERHHVSVAVTFPKDVNDRVTVGITSIPD